MSLFWCLNHPFSEEFSLNIHPKSSLAQLEAVSSCPMTSCSWQKTSAYECLAFHLVLILIFVSFILPGLILRRCILDEEGIAYWEPPTYIKCVSIDYRNIQMMVRQPHCSAQQVWDPPQWLLHGWSYKKKGKKKVFPALPWLFFSAYFVMHEHSMDKGWFFSGYFNIQLGRIWLLPGLSHHIVNKYHHDYQF